MAVQNRETRKQALRERVLDAETLKQQSRRRRRPPDRRLQRRLLLLLFVLLLLIAGGSWFLNRQYGSYSRSWIVDYTQNGATDTSNESYEIYGDGLMKVTRDGASYINAAGKTVWNQSYEIETPTISVNGEYAAIAEQGGTHIYIMGPSGTTGEAETSLPITKVAVSAKGVVYALLEDSDASYIAVFSKEGSALDISIKSVLGGDGYPVDIAVSPDGTELMASFAYLENGALRNKVVFYNLSEVGQSAGSNRVVGGFKDDFQGYLAGRVRFSDDTHAQAFYDGGVAFFSTKVLTSPELTANVKINNTILSIAYDKDYVALITGNAQESNASASDAAKDDPDPYRLLVYRTDGRLVFDRSFDFNYSGFRVDQKHVLLYHDQKLRVYDIKGKLRYDGEVDLPITTARVGRTSYGSLKTSVMIGSTGKLESLLLK